MFNCGDLVRTSTDSTEFDGMGIVDKCIFVVEENIIIISIKLQGYDYTLPFVYDEVILLQSNS